MTVANLSTRDWPASVLVAARLISLAVLCAALYWGQAVLVPLVLAALLTILLSPLVTRLDRLRVPRIVGVLLVMTLAGAAIGGVGYVVAGQLRTFAAELPMHQQNIRTKIRQVIAFTRGGALEHVQDTIEDIGNVVEESTDPPPSARERRRDDEPLRVTVEESPALMGNAQWLGPLFGAAGTIGLTLLLAIFMLVKREDLRDRLVSLSGGPSLVVATKAFADAGARISRYLVMQFVVNGSMGVAVGVGLYFIDVPYAALWGLAAGVLRYIPYVGPWIAALLPIIVSLVTTPGWQQVAMVVSLFVVLELLSNNIMEPLLYGHSVGLSELSVIVAAIFWTWLWGPVGLVIATPITACLVVLSTHVPPLGAIGRLSAWTLHLEIDGIERFASERKFFSYCRLVPGSDNSGPRTRNKRSRAGNRYLKLAFSHAAVRAVQRYAEVGAAYRKKLRRKNKPLAHAWVRKELARIVYHVLKDDVDYDDTFRGVALSRPKRT